MGGVLEGYGEKPRNLWEPGGIVRDPFQYLTLFNWAYLNYNFQIYSPQIVCANIFDIVTSS